MIRKYLYYVLAIIIFLIILFTGSNISGEILLSGYARLAELFYNNAHVYVDGIGYAEVSGAYVIGRDCLGTNFIALMFVTITVPFLKHFNGRELFWLTVCFISAIVVGLAVNAVRIIASIPFAGFRWFGIIHAAIGIVLYLAVLTGIYILLIYCVRRIH